MRGIETFTIGEHKYEVQKLVATRGYKLSLRVGQMIGPSFGIIIDGVGLGDTKADENFLEKLAQKSLGEDFFEKAIGSLTKNVSEDDLDYLVSELKGISSVYIDGKLRPMSVEFDTHFQGAMIQFFKWLGLAVKAQIGDFSDVLESAAISQDGTKVAIAR